MSTTRKSRRRELRHPVSREKLAWVEFEYPGPGGKRHRLPLINVSRAGVAFLVNSDDGRRVWNSGRSCPRRSCVSKIA